MRSAHEMLDLILSVALRDERVRIVGLNGSRANPNAPPDTLQDFDIVYLVTEMDSFLQDPSWIDVFGERIILQLPEAMALYPPTLGDRFTYLMQFSDGNRIDLSLIPLAEKDVYAREDSLTVILLDKDNALPPLPPPSDVDYHAKRPSAAFYADCCNEFWWTTIYVAKGLWREEFLYAAWHLEHCVRAALLQMLEWQVGLETGHRVSVGKFGKYLQRYLAPETWRRLVSSYTCGSYADCWSALETLIALFREAAGIVGTQLDYPYPADEDRKVSAYLQHIRALPRPRGAHPDP